MLAIVLSAVGWLFFAVHQTPRFYDEAVRVEPARRKQGSDQMLRRSAAVISDVKKKKPWEAIFSADEINGWLAVDLVENYPHLLPAELRDPRVAIGPHEIVVGCRYEGPRVSTVVSIEAGVTLQEPDVLAIRIRHARAGAVPLPLDKLLPEVSRTLQSAGCLVEQRQVEADPVLIVTLPARADRSGKGLPVLEKLELRDGEIYIAGQGK